MKSKTSITLEDDLLRKIDRLSKEFGSRSAVIEEALYQFLKSKEKEKRESRDLRILNDRADALNREAADSLDYQVEL